MDRREAGFKPGITRVAIGPPGARTQALVRRPGAEQVDPMTNACCEALGIDVPALEDVKDHREANTFAMLIIALLERGHPMTLTAAAERFAAAGVAPAERSLLSLKRCRPARPPVYRVGDKYSLDPHDDELRLWAFRLGLRPPEVPRLQLVRGEPEPLPTPDTPLTVARNRSSIP